VAAEKPSSPLTVTLDGRPYRFPLPAGTADGGAIARRAAETWRALKTLVWRERLAGSPADVVHATYRAVAPDELAYEIAGGSQAVIIGSTRWDRPTPQGRWQASEQRPKLTQPVPFWDTSLNAHVIGAGRFRGRPAWRVSFFDPATPAWFTAWIGRSDYRTLELDMVAAAHFMHHVYGPFNAPIHLVPPAS